MSCHYTRNPGALPFRLLLRTTSATPVLAEPLRALRGPPPRQLLAANVGGGGEGGIARFVRGSAYAEN